MHLVCPGSVVGEVLPITEEARISWAVNLIVLISDTGSKQITLTLLERKGRVKVFIALYERHLHTPKTEFDLRKRKYSYF